VFYSTSERVRRNLLTPEVLGMPVERHGPNVPEELLAFIFIAEVYRSTFLWIFYLLDMNKQHA
jgi:hypothetical protein